MNILFCSIPFRPSVGGIETVSALLAERFHRSGHRVALVTRSVSDTADAEPFEIDRLPSMRRLFERVRWADVVFHNNISLKFAWPQLVLSRPWVVAHHTWIPSRGPAGRIKRQVLGQARHIAVSRAIAASLPVPSTVIPNPYADDVFKPVEGIARDRELVFLGRLVSDKGVDVLIDALARLAREGRRIGLTVIGDGPELPALRRQAHLLGLDGRIDFVGRRSGVELVRLLHAHQILVVPSVWEEPFGVVALEGLACGCVPIVSNSGGLPDAVGDCGRVVAPRDAAALAQAIEALLGDPPALDRHRALAPAHLARHTRERVAGDYLQILSDAHRAHVTSGSPRAV